MKGIAYCLCDWLYGCRRITVQPEEAQDGKPAEMFTVDEPQLEIFKKAAVSRFNPETPEQEKKRSHGPRQDAIRQGNPMR